MASTLEAELSIGDAASVHDRQPSAHTSLKWAAYVTFFAIVVGGLAIVPRVLRRIDDAHPPPSAFAASGIGLVKQLAAHRLELPQYSFVGRPSPDGRYLSAVDLNGDLCLHDLATGRSGRLTNHREPTAGAGPEMAISRNGHSIAYTWSGSNGNEMRLVNDDGSSQRLLFRKPDVLFPDPLQWSVDGTQILAMLETTAGTNQLVLVSVATGSIKVVKEFEGGQYHLALSGDGRFVAFDQPQDFNSGLRDIFIVSTDGGVAHRIVEHAANDLFPLWTADGRLLFVSDRTGSLGLWAVPIFDGQVTDAPQLLVRDVGRLADAFGLTGDGTLFYRLQNGMVDVYVQSLRSDYTAAAGAEPVSPTLMGANISSEWSPDGSQLAYVAMRGSLQNDRYSRVLVVRAMESGQERNLRPRLFSFIEPRWSPNGRAILVRGADTRNREGLFVVDPASGQTRAAVLFPGDAVYPATFQWSPDGTAVWYDNASVGAIVARDFISGREHVIVNYKEESVQRLMQWPGFRVSHDGNSIAYTGMIVQGGKAATVVVVRRLGSPPQEIARATSPERVEFQDWLPDDSGVLLIKRNVKDRTNVLCEARLDGSPIRRLDISAGAMRDVGVNRDGKAITYTAGMNSIETWVLENFLAPRDPAGRKN